MKAAILTGARSIEIKDIDEPQLTSGDIKIEVLSCGVCGSDIHMWQAGHGWSDSHEPFVMGHEFCGSVIDAGDSNFKKGDRVVFWANLYCGKCEMCRQGLEHLCHEVNGKNYIGFVCNGGYAQYFVGKSRNAYKLPDSVSDVAAATIDPLMVAYHAVKRANIKLNDKVLITGSGIIGNFIAALAKKSGASLVAMTKISDKKIVRSRELGFVDAYFDANKDNLREDLINVSQGGFDIAFEAVGNSLALNTCIDDVKSGSRVVMIGNSLSEYVDFAMNKAVLHELSLLGSVSCTEKEFSDTINLISSGTIVPEDFVTDIVSLDKLQEIMLRLTAVDDPILKAVIMPNRDF